MSKRKQFVVIKHAILAHKLSVLVLAGVLSLAVGFPALYLASKSPSPQTSVNPSGTHDNEEPRGADAPSQPSADTAGQEPAGGSQPKSSGTPNNQTISTSNSPSQVGGGSAPSSEPSPGGGSPGGGGGVINSPPTAPSNATATIIMYNRVTIRVNRATDSNGIARHELLRDGAVVVTSTSANSLVVLSDTSVVVGQTYTFTVRAVDTLGAVGPSSNGVVVTVPPQDLTPPSVPANFRLVSNVPGSITLAWDPSSDDQTAQNEIWYRLRSPADGSNYYTQTMQTTHQTYWFDQPGLTHDIYVEAFDLSGNTSAKAGPVTFTAQ